MRRQDESTAKDIVIIASYMPWWACLALAVISFLIFNAISKMPSPPMEAGQAGNYLANEAMKIFGMFAQIVVPGLLAIAGIISAAKKSKGEEPSNGKRIIAYILMGIITFFIAAAFFIFSMIGRNAGKMFDNIHKNGQKAVKQSQMHEKQQTAPKNTGTSWTQYGFQKKQEQMPKPEKKDVRQDQIYKFVDKNGNVTYTNMPSKINSGTISPVRTKPLETLEQPSSAVKEKTIYGYIIYKKNGKTMNCKKIAQYSPGILTMIDGPVSVEIPVNEISRVDEDSSEGIRALQPDSTGRIRLD